MQVNKRGFQPWGILDAPINLATVVPSVNVPHALKVAIDIPTSPSGEANTYPVEKVKPMAVYSAHSTSVGPRGNVTTPEATARQMFMDAVIQIPGVLNVEIQRDRGNRETIYVSVPNIFRGAAWKVTELQCRIEDAFPSVSLEVALRGISQEQSGTEELPAIEASI